MPGPVLIVRAHLRMRRPGASMHKSTAGRVAFGRDRTGRASHAVAERTVAACQISDFQDEFP